jgi:glycosidase
MDVPSTDWFNQNDHAIQTGERLKNQSQRRMGWRRPEPLKLPATIEEYEALTQEQKDKIKAGFTTNPDALVNTTHYKWTLLDPHAPQTEKDILVEGWFSGGMPDLNQKNRHLAKYLIQNSIWWIEYSRIDGIRMDTYPYADYNMMEEWCQEIEKEYPNFNIVGEGWYPRNSAAGWWQRGAGMNKKDSGLKSVMDFDLTFTTKKEILKESNTSEGSEAGLFKIYECITQDFLIPDPNNVLVFLDNHDIARFMDEGDPIWKFKQGLALLLTTRGIPQMYYGTEIAMAGPKALRADFPGGWQEDKVSAFTPEGRTQMQNECWNYASKLLNWRKTSRPVTEGKLIHYTPDNNTKCYVYARTDGKNTVLVILNGSDTIRFVDTHRFSEVIGKNTKGKDVVTGEIIDLESLILIPARSTYILELSE